MVMVVVVLASTCGTRPSVTQAEYCEQLSLALCDFFRRCGVADPEASCAAMLTSNTLQAEGTPGCMKDFEPEGAAECLAELRIQSCGVGGPACSPSRRSVEGAPCKLGCGPGLKCSDACGRGTCVPSCSAGTGCAPKGVGEPCQPLQPPGCKTGLRCVANRCAEVPPADQIPCQSGAECPGDARCEGGTATDRRCSFGRGFGSRCDDQNRCLRGLMCSDASDGTCLRIADVGGTCGDSVRCPANTECFGGVCLPRGDAGMPCPCLPELSCVDGVCVLEPRRAEGESCTDEPTSWFQHCGAGLACMPSGDAGGRVCVPFQYVPPTPPSMCP